MKLKRIVGISSVLCLGMISAPAQQAGEVEQLRKQLQQMQETFEKQQQLQRQQIEVLKQQIESLQQKQVADQEKLKQEMNSKLSELPKATAETPSATAPTIGSPGWSPSQPITIARAGSAYMNASFGTLMDIGWSSAPDPTRFLNLGDHDPNQRGFSLRNAEMAFDGAVDPYFKGFANIVLKLDNQQNTEIELEEAYLQSSSLPANLQLKAGQFFANFGRQNSQHPHQWAFVDEPIILTRAFGPDGLRNIGAQVSWLTPLPFYTETFLGVFNGQGGTAHSFQNAGFDDGTGTFRFHGRATMDRGLNGPGNLLLTPRIASSFDLTDTQTLVVGASGAFGPNDTGPNSRTEIYGVDAYWKWKSSRANEGFPFVSLQAEGLYSRFGAGADPAVGLPAENLKDLGFYSQVLWGFRPHWVAGLRGEYAGGNSGAFDASDVFRGQRTRISPNMTWYPSEFSKIRLQYNYDQGQYFGDAHSVWMQFEFLLGAHAAHKF